MSGLEDEVFKTFTFHKTWVSKVVVFSFYDDIILRSSPDPPGDTRHGVSATSILVTVVVCRETHGQKLTNGLTQIGTLNSYKTLTLVEERIFKTTK